VWVAHVTRLGPNAKVLLATGQPLRVLTASVSCGATLNRSPTTP
jgi:hypothetical protein